MQDFRVIDLPERTTLDSSDYTMIDSAENGTNKYLLSRQAAETDAKIATAVGGVEAELDAAVEGIEEDITALQSDVETVETTLETKADKDGTYPDMAVGSVLGTNTVTDREPYFIRPSASIGDREFDTLVGGSLGWNQYVDPSHIISTRTVNGITITNNNDGTVTFSGTASSDVNIAVATTIVFPRRSHKVLVSFNDPSLSISDFGCFIGGYGVYSRSNKSFIFYETDASDWIGNIAIYIASGVTLTNFRTAFNVIDLTTLFGATIADYIYSLETATAGAGVAWVRRYLPNDYYAYCAPALKHVSGVSAHVMRDANNNIIGNYPIDSTWVGMGVPKLDSANKLYFDGDTYASDGTVTERFGIRAYQSGDESLADAITDGTNTVYKLTTPTTSSASPFTSPQICDPDGTEEYVTSGLVPVGHETEYVENLADKLTDIPDLPTTAGTYSLKVTVSGGVPSYSWVSA